MKEKELLCEVARLYYEQDLTQLEISKKLFVSRSSVSRLIKEAKETGVVEILIHYPYDRMRIIEYEFQNRFDLEDIRITESENRDIYSDFTAVTKLAASYINSILKNDIIFGVTWGKSVSYSLKELKPTNYLPNMYVVQMAGSVETKNPMEDGPDIVRSVATTYNCKYRYISVPFQVENEEIKEALVKRPNVIGVLAMAENVDIFCTGISSFSERSKHLNPNDAEYLKKEGAVGFICGHYFDADGKIIDISKTDIHTICTSEKVFKKVPLRIGIGANPDKASAILAALRGGLINSLVTNTKTANKIIALDDAYKTKKNSKKN